MPELWAGAVAVQLPQSFEQVVLGVDLYYEARQLVSRFVQEAAHHHASHIVVVIANDAGHRQRVVEDL